MGAGKFFTENANIFLPVFGLFAVIIALALVGYNSEFLVPSEFTQTALPRSENVVVDQEYDYSVQVKTTYGNFTIDLFEHSAPENVNNFLTLVREGFYNNMLFHRVIAGFIIQFGYSEDYKEYNVKDEVHSFLRFEDYVVAVVNKDKPNTNGPQIFITLKDSEVEHLNDKNTIIGRVSSGHNVIDKIGEVSVNDEYKPIERVVINSILINKTPR